MSLQSSKNTDSFQHLDLNPAIFKAIAACGYTQPTPIQAQSIPSTLTGKDIVACAQTGSGKTAAFVLPALHRLSTQPASKKTRILILTPTRELATQITKAASLYGKFLKFQIVSLVGGMPYGGQIKDLARGADIIVATPGRLLDHIQNGRVNLSDIEMLVLDEADRMLDMGFIDDVQYIAKLTPAKRQTLLFSATIDKRLSSIINQLLKDPLRIDLTHEKKSIPQISQSLYKVSHPQQKWRLLKHFLQSEPVFKAIIFSATKINADKLANQLCHDGFSAAALHGDLRQNVRNRTVEQLRRGKIQLLVATDVAARGIDIPDVTHVINYDLPRFCEDYVHRIGRTGRAGKSGIAISFVMPTDMRHLQSIEKYIGKRLTLQQVEASLASNDKKEVSFTRAEPASAPQQTQQKIKIEYRQKNPDREARTGNERNDQPQNGHRRKFSKPQGSRKRTPATDESTHHQDTHQRKFSSHEGPFKRKKQASDRSDRQPDGSSKPFVKRDGKNKRFAKTENPERRFEQRDSKRSPAKKSPHARPNGKKRFKGNRD